MKIQIELYDATGQTLHAKGSIDYDKIADRQIVERNGHTYVYQTTGRVAVGIFHEAVTPYCITEF